jgi:hypothetical protein
MNANAETTKFAIPELNEGEIYAGAIIAPDGSGNHIILLPGDHKEANWDDSMEWARSIGGDLPDRVEQALLFKHSSEQFQKEWYWSNTQHAVNSDYAWGQSFGDGSQSYDNKSAELRARAVRRLTIQ